MPWAAGSPVRPAPPIPVWKGGVRGIAFKGHGAVSQIPSSNRCATRGALGKRSPSGRGFAQRNARPGPPAPSAIRAQNALRPATRTVASCRATHRLPVVRSAGLQTPSAASSPSFPSCAQRMGFGSRTLARRESATEPRVHLNRQRGRRGSRSRSRRRPQPYRGTARTHHAERGRKTESAVPIQVSSGIIPAV